MLKMLERIKPGFFRVGGEPKIGVKCLWMQQAMFGCRYWMGEGSGGPSLQPSWLRCPRHVANWGRSAMKVVFFNRHTSVILHILQKVFSLISGVPLLTRQQFLPVAGANREPWLNNFLNLQTLMNNHYLGISKEKEGSLYWNFQSMCTCTRC